ncbi:MAG: stage V sporulation protein G [Planctomycetaceae bacterium]|nr:stage V sporulation protein G [Planctomycetaceae bacterium]
MEITEVRIKLMEDAQERLQAFCSITFDHCFVIRDLKIIGGGKGSFVAMPSRKLTDRCPRCSTKNHLRALFCNQCGAQLQQERAGTDPDGRAKLYADIAHPINSRCRELIQTRVMEAFRDEQIRAKQPGYVSAYDDYGEENYADLLEPEPLASPYGRPPEPSHRLEPGHNSNAPAAPHLPPRRLNGASVNGTTSGLELETVPIGYRHALEADEGFGAGIG